MKLSLQIPNFTWPGGGAELAQRLAEVARTADALGFESVWVMDHFFQIDFVGQAEEPMLEGYSALAFLAAHTERVRLGTLVTGVTYRHPGVLAKTVTTLDILSRGRACLGIGAAWFEREHAGLGVPFPPLSERFERLEDALRICKQMWSEKVGACDGTHVRLAETLNSPQALSRPHPPIMIGGLGEKKTLRLVAQYGDAWNALGYVPIEELARKRDVLRAHCDALGRDFDEIECSTLSTVAVEPGKSADAIAQLSSHAKAGFSHAIVNLPNVHELTPLEVLANEVMPEIAGI